jgi:hypothetical protein
VGQYDQQAISERDAGTAERPPAAAATPALAAFASVVGNRAFTAMLARQGAGILPGGTVHPAVEAAITGRRGSGAGLDGGTRARFAESFGDSLDDVRVHDDPAADELARSVQARAFTTGSDVFFARGEFRPGSSDGDRLLAHELTHVIQQRGATASGPLEVSSPGDPTEVAADAAAAELDG